MSDAQGSVKAVGRGRGPWRADQGAVELRRPQSVSSPSESSSSNSSAVSSEVSEVLSLAVQSTLSINAKEFVPRNFSFAASEPDNSGDDGNQNGQSENDETDIYMTDDEWIVHCLSDKLRNLTDNPGAFDRLTKQLLIDLMPVLSIEETLEHIVMLIINQAISERNFRYSGARLCSLLNAGENSTFRRVLLTKLCDEHGLIEDNMTNNPSRVYGFVHFLGELYIQLEVSEGTGQRIAVVGDAIVQALSLLIQIPVLDNIKNTCDVLKLAGRLLDSDQPDVMTKFFSEFQSLLNDERAGDRVKDLIRVVLKLRSENWGHSLSSENPSPAGSVTSDSTASVWTTEGVYYGPDHQALTAEEYKFLNDSCGAEVVPIEDDLTVWDPNVNDSENAEIMAAFQEFVKQKPR